MNPTLELNFWARLIGILAVEIICVIALAFLAQSLIRSAFWRRTIWQISFVCLLLLAVAEFTGIGRGFSIWLAGKPVPERTVSVRIVPTDEQFIPSAMDFEIPEPVFIPQKETPIAQSIWWPGILWLAGFGFIVARILFARVLFVVLRLRKQQIKDLVLLERVSELAKRLGINRRIRLLESSGLTSPVAFGIHQPSIGLPSGFAQNFSIAQQNAMLTHELAHLAARDPFWYLLADCAAAIFWWHPAIWFARRRLHSASEHAADETAAILENGPGTLAECLVYLGQQLTRRRSFGWLGVEGNGFRSHLGQRVERLLNLKEANRPLRSWKIFVAKTSFTILFAAVVIFTSGWIQNGNERREKNLSSAVQKSWNRSFASTAFAALAKEKAEGKKKNDQAVPGNPPAPEYDPLSFETLIFENVPSEQLQNVLDEIKLGGAEPTLLRMFGVSSLSSNAFPKALAALSKFKEQMVAPYDFVGSKFSGMNLTYQGSPTNSENACQYFTEIEDGLNVVTGAEMSYRSSNTWSFSLVPQKIADSIQIDLVWSNAPYNLKIPVGGGVILHRVTQKPLRSEVIVFSAMDIHRENKPATNSALNGKAEPTKEQLAELFPRLFRKTEDQTETGATNPTASPKPTPTAVEKGSKFSLPRKAVQIPNPAARTNLIHTSKGQQAIKTKLDEIRLSEVQFENLPLVEVLKMLRDASRERDAEQVGINFMFNPHANNTTPRAVLTDDPNRATVMPIPSTPVEAPVDLEKIIIRINPSLENVRLADVLDAIVQSASHPIEYRIEDYAVVFSPKATNGIALYTHVFKLDPNRFQEALEFMDGFSNQTTRPSNESRTNLQNNSINLIVRNFFTVAGVVFGPSGTPNGKSVFFNDRTGLLMVRATMEDLEIIQTALESINHDGVVIFPTTSEADYQTRVFKVNPRTFSQSLKGNSSQNITSRIRDFFGSAGVNFGIPGQPNGKSLLYKDRLGWLMIRATPDDLKIIEKALAPFPPEPPQVTIETKFVEIDEAAIEKLGSNWLSQNTIFLNTNQTSLTMDFMSGDLAATRLKAKNNSTNPHSETITGILSDSQYESVFKALEELAGTDILSAPRLTTLSGRQSQISVLDMRNIVTGVSTNTTAKGDSEIMFKTESLPFGPSMDVLPAVSADGLTIQMNLTASVTEFLGYDDPGEFVVRVKGKNGKPVTAPFPLPRSRLREATTIANVWDGQTVLLDGIRGTQILKMKDKVPVLGDIPLFGRMFRSESSTTVKRNIMVFITPTIIDSAGNRVHSEKELSFTTNSVPKQPERK